MRAGPLIAGSFAALWAVPASVAATPLIPGTYTTTGFVSRRRLSLELRLSIRLAVPSPAEADQGRLPWSARRILKRLETEAQGALNSRRYPDAACVGRHGP
jgi:hypothetical protein